MGRKCRCKSSCRQKCCDPCANQCFNQCANQCFDPCANQCFDPCCFNPCCVTNIAVTGTGPFGPLAFICFTVTNTTTVPAQNVVVTIPVPIQTGASLGPGGAVPTIGSTSVTNNVITWNVGTLNGGQSGTVNINQVNGQVASSWTATGTTITPETTLADNVATVIVPVPG